MKNFYGNDIGILLHELGFINISTRVLLLCEVALSLFTMMGHLLCLNEALLWRIYTGFVASCQHINDFFFLEKNRSANIEKRHMLIFSKVGKRKQRLLKSNLEGVESSESVRSCDVSDFYQICLHPRRG